MSNAVTENKKIKLLVVAENTATCSRIFEKLAGESEIAYNHCTDASKVIEIAETFAPNVIIQTIAMPEGDGQDMLRLYRKTASTLNIPVLMLFDQEDPEKNAQSFGLGANDCLYLNSDNIEFISRIKYHARKYQIILDEESQTSARMVQSKHNIKVLFVEESKSTCKMISFILSKEKDLVFEFCSNVNEVLSVADDFLPTIILQSLLFDKIDGFELLSMFRNNPSTRDVPIIVLSGTEDVRTKARAFSSGADDYVIKSNDCVEMLSRIRSHSNTYFNRLKDQFSSGSGNQIEPENIKVLMIDDSETICMSISSLLKSERDIAFTYSTNPLDAIEIAKQFGPTVILQDLVMPQIDGLELLRNFREEPSTRDTPIIVLSGETDASIKSKVFALGANDYMEKRMDKIELISRIQYHSKGYINTLKLNESMQQLLEAQKRLEIHNNFILKTFGRYLSDDIVDSILESPEGMELGGEKRELTILMSDLRGFTAISERLPAEEVVGIINIYLETMTEIILKYKGTIDEFIGDSIFVIFGAPILRDDDALRAVACSMEMQLAMEEVNRKCLELGYPEVHQGIGINTGQVAVGNIGSEKRMKYGCVGRNVNLTARIESYTVGGQTYISERTLAACGDILRVDDQMEVMPKGVKEPLTIYEIGGVGGDVNIFLPPKKELELLDLSEPLAIHFTVLAGKHASDDYYTGTITRIIEQSAEIKADIELETLGNIKISLFDDQENQITSDLYAKVTDVPSSESFRVNFTSIPPEAEVFLQKILNFKTERKND